MPSAVRHIAALLLVFAVSGCASSGAGRSAADAHDLVDVQILAINDFHGNLEPPAGSNGRLGDLTVGGIEYLSAHVARLEAENPNTVVVAAGDNVGASPLLSSLFHDEPTIRALGVMGLDFTTVGNHEFDEGWQEVLRLQHGGCHPVDGCRVTSSFDGAAFRYLAANVRVDSRNDTLFPATAMRTFGGVSVGFIGLVLRGTPGLVSPMSVEGLTFLPEAETANAAAAALRRDGADIVVVMIHEGGYPAADDDESCRNMTGDIVEIVKAMSPAIDVVVSGHTNRTYICHMNGRLLTSTASFSRQITDIDITFDRRSRRVVSKRARNIPVTHDVTPDARMTTIMDEYRPLATETGRRPVGSVAGTLTRTQNRAGESTIGNAVADAYLQVAQSTARGGADLALMNWGGLRSDLVHSGEDDSTTTPVTYADVFKTLPFGNVIVVRTLTGEQIADILEQQFEAAAPSSWKVLQVSHNFAYSWSAVRPAGSRVDRASIRLNGQPLDPAARYRVAMPDFLWDGGDGFTKARAGTDPVSLGSDDQTFMDYLRDHSPIRVSSLGRITRED